MEFLDRHWKRIGERGDRSIVGQIAEITSIDPRYLTGKTNNLSEVSVATKLSWMAGRTTEQVEDIAYSLIGLLGVSMIPNYGEGLKAFQSLQIALFSAGNDFDESLFAWTTPGKLWCYSNEKFTAKFDKKEWGLLAPSPDCFTASSGVQKKEISPRRSKGFDWNNQGVTVSLPWRETRNSFGVEKKAISFGLNCLQGDKQVVIELARVSEGGRVVWKRSECEKLGRRPEKKITGKSLGVQQPSAAYNDITVAQKTYDPSE